MSPNRPCSMGLTAGLPAVLLLRWQNSIGVRCPRHAAAGQRCYVPCSLGSSLLAGWAGDTQRGTEYRLGSKQCQLRYRLHRVRVASGLGCSTNRREISPLYLTSCSGKAGPCIALSTRWHYYCL